MEEETINISIPKKLGEEIMERCKGTGFHSVRSYVIHALKQFMSSPESKYLKEDFSKEDKEKVKERLRKQGYSI